MNLKSIATSIKRTTYGVSGTLCLAVAIAGATSPSRAESIPTATAKAEAVMTFKSVWKIGLPADTSKIAVADVMGDGKLRLLTLGAEGMLTVHKLVEGKPEKEGSVSLGKEGAKFVVGSFSKGKPAIIVAPKGTFYWDKDKFAQKPAFEGEGVFASVKMKDGAEVFCCITQTAPPALYSLDLSLANAFKAEGNLPEIQPKGSDLREITLDLPKEMFDRFPEEVKAGAIARVFDPRKEGRLFGLFSWQTADSSHVVVFDGNDLFPEPSASAKPVWKSQKLEGKILGIALGGDLKGTKQVGFYLLLETGADKKERVLEFFALE